MKIEEISNDRKRRVLLDSPDSWKVIMETVPIRELYFEHYGLHMIRIQVLNREMNYNRMQSRLTKEWRDVSYDPFLLDEDGTIGRRISRTEQLEFLKKAAKGND